MARINHILHSQHQNLCSPREHIQSPSLLTTGTPAQNEECENPFFTNDDMPPLVDNVPTTQQKDPEMSSFMQLPIEVKANVKAMLKPGSEVASEAPFGVEQCSSCGCSWSCTIRPECDHCGEKLTEDSTNPAEQYAEKVN